ncbi:transcription factor, member of the histone acetyltransferase SAGA complex [Scheffersomyces coipomensis]|uniref:transcription factor, member of the histone acetyltransferase SAGA complex n=1 Tax=Scheffersomyces coipomensis TaxID=1788519 RepID=UPI00315D4E87
MDKLTTFKFNNSRKLFGLAKKLHDSKFFETFLNESQYKILDYIINLDDFKLWYNFLEGDCFVKFTKSTGDDSNDEKKESSNDEDDTPEIQFEEGSKNIKMLALHIRYLLWEKAIDYYYTAKDLDTSIYNIEEVTDDFELIDTLDDLPGGDNDGEAAQTDNIEKSAPAPVIREEEDDYDDDDDEDEDEEEDKKKESEDVDMKEPESEVSELKFNDDNQVILEIPISIFATSTPNNSSTDAIDSQTTSNQESISAATSQIQNNNITTLSSSASTTINNKTSAIDDQDKLIKEFNKVYHNFEYDRETLIKRRKLEKSDLQLENSKSTNNDNNGNLTTGEEPMAGINLGTGSTSLQHLLNTIKSKREEVSLNDHELRSLFMDVRKNRGKWASNDKVGQEELYEACEKVVLELRAYSEHSTPFLNKVSKREAPNYGLIIKKPMDLNTALKKLKSFAYNSKQEFVDDLMLIWSNCLTYNADPKHFMRTHALAMQKKTLKLAPTIPNITIRNRADIEKEEELEEEKNGGGATPLEASGKSMKKGRKSSRQDQVKAEATEPGTPISLGPSVVDSPSGTNLTSETPAAEGSAVVGNTTNGDEDEEEEEENDNLNGDSNGINEEEDDEFDPELLAWRSLTSKSRANYCSQRAELFDENYHLRPDAAAIIRQSIEMKNFNQYLSNKEVISKSQNLLENDEPYLLEYDLTGGIPGFKYNGINEAEEDLKEQKMADILLQQVGGDASKLKSAFVLPQDKGLNKVYFENIHEIQEIRKICFKISLIRQMQTQQFVHHTQMKQPEVEAIREVDVDNASKLPNHDAFSEDVQFAVLRRNVAKIAMQTGFEKTEPFAVNTLTQLAEKYLSNLIKSIKLHTESNSSNEMDETSILLVSLLENGVNKPDDLYTYVQERIVRQSEKLVDLRAKLSNFLKDLLRPGLENFNERSFEDNSEQFMTGDFSNDLGDDFFGFKELGLDREFNMLSSSIPIYLLHSRLHNSYASSGGVSKRNKYEDLKDYTPPYLTAVDVDKQIGILRPFYNKLNEKSKAHYIKVQKKKGEPYDLPEDSALLLIEDDELPQKQRNIRPRLPPTGRITAIKKKIIANSFFLPDSEGGDEPVLLALDDRLNNLADLSTPELSGPDIKSPMKSAIKSEA